jgi:hypothetical protein
MLEQEKFILMLQDKIQLETMPMLQELNMVEFYWIACNFGW